MRCWYKWTTSPTGLPLLPTSLWVPAAEEHCDAAAQQCSAEPGQSNTKARAPSAGETCVMTRGKEKMVQVSLMNKNL